MTQQIRPARLKDGARIGIVSPAYWLDDERLQRAVGVFEDAGFVVVPGKSTRLRENIFAGSPEARAADIMAMFNLTSLEMLGARPLSELPNCSAFVERMSARPAYQKAMDIAGPGASRPEA